MRSCGLAPFGRCFYATWCYWPLPRVSPRENGAQRKVQPRRGRLHSNRLEVQGLQFKAARMIIVNWWKAKNEGFTVQCLVFSVQRSVFRQRKHLIIRDLHDLCDRMTARLQDRTTERPVSSSFQAIPPASFFFSCSAILSDPSVNIAFMPAFSAALTFSSTSSINSDSEGFREYFPIRYS